MFISSSGSFVSHARSAFPCFIAPFSFCSPAAFSRLQSLFSVWCCARSLMPSSLFFSLTCFYSISASLSSFLPSGCFSFFCRFWDVSRRAQRLSLKLSNSLAHTHSEVKGTLQHTLFRHLCSAALILRPLLRKHIETQASCGSEVLPLSQIRSHDTFVDSI